MPDRGPRIYWDANVFLHYIEGTPASLPTLDAILHAASTTGRPTIYTSTVSIAEVAYHAEEKARLALDPAVQEALDALWADRSAIQLVETTRLDTMAARDLQRWSIAQGWGGLKPMDAIHLATARRMGVTEFHTYEETKLDKYGPEIGCTVVRPYTTQPMLPDLSL